MIGAPVTRILFKHIFKNATRTLPLIFTLNASEAILTLAGLGFIGFGIDPHPRRVGLRPERSIADVIGHLVDRCSPDSP